MLVITVISASVDSQKVIDNDIDEIANKASPKTIAFWRQNPSPKASNAN
jgi:hypothetical protein